MVYRTILVGIKKDKMTTQNKYTIFLEPDKLEKLREIAFELGYVWGNKGSISKLLIGICKGEVTLNKENTNYKIVKKENE